MRTLTDFTEFMEEYLKNSVVEKEGPSLPDETYKRPSDNPTYGRGNRKKMVEPHKETGRTFAKGPAKPQPTTTTSKEIF